DPEDGLRCPGAVRPEQSARDLVDDAVTPHGDQEPLPRFQCSSGRVGPAPEVDLLQTVVEAPVIERSFHGVELAAHAAVAIEGVAYQDQPAEGTAPPDPHARRTLLQVG